MHKTTIQGVLATFVLCFGMWLLFSWSLAVQELIVGAVMALLVSLFCSRFLINDSPGYLFRPDRLGQLLYYSLVIFPSELWKANVDVAKRAFRKDMPINPGIVKIPVSLHSEYGQAMLANSITLTPGTITLDTVDEENGQTWFYIHWLDVATTDPIAAGEAIKGRMEKHIRRIWH